MDKPDERIEVLQENNSAQTTLESILKLKSKKTNEISVSTSLSGNLDLKLLASLGFKKIRHLLFSPGQITSLHNIPDGITHMVCEDNLLESIDNVPDTIETLDVTRNTIQSIDLSRLQKLKVLRLSHNELTELGGFPESLEELYCSYNQIKSLDLKNTPNLKVLHCRDNVGLELQNLPDTIVDAQLPDTVVMKHHENPRQKRSKEVKDYIKQYYQIKSKYETQLKKIRAKQKEKNTKYRISPKCAGCGKPVGMIFSRKEEKLTAFCGSRNPCNWKILIHLGFFQSQTKLLYLFLEEIEEMKEKFIRHKLNTVFEYIAEKDSARLFEKELKLYQSTSEQVNQLLDIYNDKYFSEQKRETIQQKQKLIQEKLLLVKEALANHDVEQAVRLQQEDIAPLAKAIQRDSYEVTKLVSVSKEKGLIVEQETSDSAELTHFLVQQEISMEKLDENLGENPSVERFGTKKMD